MFACHLESVFEGKRHFIEERARENAVDDLVQAGTSLQLHTFVLYVLLFGCLNTLVCKAKVWNVSSGLKMAIMACFDSSVQSALHDGGEGIESP